MQVLDNLLGNAVCYSPESAQIRVNVVRDGDHVAVSVVDRGQGVSPERLPHLFRKFPRLEDREAGETGCGLSLGI